ncbi:hypothetical protein ABEB36_003716 [Hypothenemus hampei]|uniref:DNA primase large subunit n=1 Tax=Hypothenemus hampei TaxID=57062 RepID=A0ABD1F0W1_HYPHA
MDIMANRRRAHKGIIDTHSELYPHDISMYTELPRHEIQLFEFQELALERLQLLRIIDQAQLKGFKYLSTEWIKCIKDDLVKNNLKKFARLMSGLGGQTELDIQARRADHISHYILKMSFCTTEELRKWFITKEMDWFKIRFIAQKHEDIQKFISSNNFSYTPITQEEKEEIKEELIDSSPAVSEYSIHGTDFYKVPFQEITSLVKNRKVLLKNGYGYVYYSDLVVPLISQFRSHLSETLNQFHHRLDIIDDERITELIKNVRYFNTGEEYSTNVKEEINLADLDTLAKKNFPPCMKHLHEVLKANHHLKHDGRLIYGLFLKSIGLRYELFIEFWRNEFTKKMDEDSFNKHHLYNFNHQYGKVGRRVSYSAYSCMKIIMNVVAPGDPHGCPFKCFGPDNLRAKLVEEGISEQKISEIENIAHSDHYQLACTKYFEAVHSQPPKVTINHPTSYFQQSISLIKDK